MKRAMAFVAVAGCILAALGCGGVPGTGGGGGSGDKMAPMDTTSPYMYAMNLSGYKVGQWASYKQEPGGMGTTLKVVEKTGDDLWIEVHMSMSGMEYCHLLKVAPDRKVTKAWFSSKGYDKWEPVKINESPTGTGETATKCAACGKAFDEHKKPDITEGDETVACGDKSLSCKMLSIKMYKCDGTDAGTANYCFSTDVPDLHGMYTAGLKAWGKSMSGGLAKYEFVGSMTIVLTGCGTDAKPKHELPKE
jgi:hypothetical protein